MKIHGYKKSIGMLTILSISIFVLVSACQGEKNKNAQVPLPIPGPGQCIPGQPCQIIGGPNGGFALATGVGSLDNNPNGSMITLTFSAPQPIPINNNGTMPPYQGPVSAVGEIIITTPVLGCPGIIPGRFPITQTLTQGSWTNGSFFNLVVRALNGMVIKLPNNFLATQYGGGNPVRIKNPIYISTTGGPDCAFVSM